MIWVLPFSHTRPLLPHERSLQTLQASFVKSFIFAISFHFILERLFSKRLFPKRLFPKRLFSKRLFSSTFSTFRLFLGFLLKSPTSFRGSVGYGERQVK